MSMTAEEIAAGLTKAQREAVLGAEQAHGTNAIMVLPLYRDGGRTSRSLVDLRIAGYSSRGAALNKLGKQVRAILERQS